MPLILPGNVATALGGDYEVANSCRFNDDDSAQLAITPSSDGSAEKWTLSFWMKMGGLTTDQRTVRAYAVSSSGSRSSIYFDAVNQFSVGFNPSGSSWTTCTLQSSSANMKFSDPGGWMHFVVACDTTQGTAANRLKGYVNGVQKAFDAYPAEDMDTMFNKSGRAQYIGWRGYTTGYLDDYLAEVYWIDGTQYAASDFGEYDDDSPRIWKPKDASGLTFGTNGYYLDFENSSSLGNDAAGSNNLTVTNLVAADQCVDTPTNNFATLNPLGFAGTRPTFSQGNLNAVCGTGVSLYSISTIGVSKGKWYVEGEIEASSADSGNYYHDFGFADRPDTDGTAFYVSAGRLFWASAHDGKINYRTGGTTTAGLVTGVTTTDPGDFFQLYLDMDNELMYWGRNGALLNSTGLSFNGKESLTGEYFFAFGDQFANGTTEYAVNFGQGSIDGAATTSYNDAKGYGNFKYDPSVTTDEGDKDFLALCTKNLADYGG